MAPTLWLGENAVMAHQGFQLCLAYVNGVAIPNGDHDELMAKHTSCLKEDDFFTTWLWVSSYHSTSGLVYLGACCQVQWCSASGTYIAWKYKAIIC